MLLGTQAAVAGSGAAPVGGEPRAFQTDGINKYVNMGALFAGMGSGTVGAFTFFFAHTPTTIAGSTGIFGSETGFPVFIMLNGSFGIVYAYVARDGGWRERRMTGALVAGQEDRIAVTWGGGVSDEIDIYRAGAIANRTGPTTLAVPSDDSLDATIALRGSSYGADINRCVGFCRAELSGAQVAALDDLIVAYSAAVDPAAVAAAEAAVVAYLTAIDAGAIFCPVDSLDDLTTSIRDACGNNNLTPVNMDAGDLVAVP